MCVLKISGDKWGILIDYDDFQNACIFSYASAYIIKRSSPSSDLSIPEKEKEVSFSKVKDYNW